MTEIMSRDWLNLTAEGMAELMAEGMVEIIAEGMGELRA